ncbi:SHOCT domain-containing protein [Corynebacterium variabile]|uniref:SHOCT domain-containing protein n=1 Tax=Corynebacterium variabile TaxID=1727 RepID=UPI0028A2D3F3|nr:SHOCT domain-containing protein [Corynebacterium variabile]
MSLQRTYRRTLTIAPEAVYQPLINGIPTIKDCVVTDAGNPIRVDRKRNIMANRWAMSAAIGIDGPDLTITIDGNGTAPSKFAEELFDLLPDGAIDDHGVTVAQEAMAKGERFFGFRELGGLLNDLRAGENVLQMVTGSVDGHVALIIITTRRILTKDKGAFDKASREILPKHVTSISTGRKLGNDWLHLTVSGQQVKFTSMRAGRADQLAEHIRRLRDAETTPTADTPAGPGVDDLARLAELHAAGVLTDDEFTAAKAKALGL